MTTPHPTSAPRAQVVVVFGGRSEIGLALAERLAPGNVVVLAARPGPMDDAVARVRTAGATRVETVSFDADDTAAHETLVDRVEQIAGAPIDVAVAAFGILGDQERAEHDPAHVVEILQTDFVAQASLLTALAERMRPRRHGTIVAFSSVAGVRVRRANYVYGSAKAGLDGFALGLADALRGSGVRLVVVRPGFVIGRMTRGMKAAPFSSTPEQVAEATANFLERGTGTLLWVPWQLRAMFSVAHAVPRPVWRRLPR